MDGIFPRNGIKEVLQRVAQSIAQSAGGARRGRVHVSALSLSKVEQIFSRHSFKY